MFSFYFSLAKVNLNRSKTLFSGQQFDQNTSKVHKTKGRTLFVVYV